MQISTYLCQITGKSFDELFNVQNPLVRLEQKDDDPISISYWDTSLTISKPTAKDLIAASTAPEIPIVADYQSAIQVAVDSMAKAKQFNDGITLASYANSTVAAWAAQATAFIAWRDQVWTYAYEELAKVQAKTRTAPTVVEFLAELPHMTWPS